MIRRILVVAEREVRETVLRRAFLMVLLTPLGMLVMVLALAVALPALVTWLGPSVEPASVLEVCPPSLVEPVRAGLPEWRIETCGAVERSTLDARVTLDDDGRVHVQVRHRDDTVALVRAVDHAVLAEQLHEAGVDPTALEQASREVVAEGWREDRAELAELRGAILGTGVSVLLFLALLIAGQQVLMATLEEKGNRVIEILLGAVGPGELFVGKLAGQLVVALVFAASWGIPALLLVPLVGLWIGPVTVLEIALFLIVDLVGWMALTAGVGSLLSDLGEARQAVGRAMPLMLALVFVGWGGGVLPRAPHVAGARCPPADLRVRDAGAPGLERAPTPVAGGAGDELHPRDGGDHGLVRARAVPAGPVAPQPSARPPHPPPLAALFVSYAVFAWGSARRRSMTIGRPSFSASTPSFSSRAT